MKRESKVNLSSGPSIKRHGTEIRFGEHLRPTRRRIKSGPSSISQGVGSAEEGPKEGPKEGGDGGNAYKVSVELESCVSSLKLVRLQMEKDGELLRSVIVM